MVSFSRWAEIEGGPLHLSADGGQTSLAIFQAWDNSNIPGIGVGAAFKLCASEFIEFAKALETLMLPTAQGTTLRIGDVVDFELSFAYNFVDPFGNQLELNCYDYSEVRPYLEQAGIKPRKLW